MCQHEEFHARVEVNRITDTGRFSADITIKCTQCGTPMEFLGLQPGLDTHGARVSIDGTEARMAISPRGITPNPLQRMAFNIRRFDS